MSADHLDPILFLARLAALVRRTSLATGVVGFFFFDVVGGFFAPVVVKDLDQRHRSPFSWRCTP